MPVFWQKVKIGEDEGEYDSKSSSPRLTLRATRDEGLWGEYGEDKSE